MAISDSSGSNHGDDSNSEIEGVRVVTTCLAK